MSYLPEEIEAAVRELVAASPSSGADGAGQGAPQPPYIYSLAALRLNERVGSLADALTELRELVHATGEPALPVVEVGSFFAASSAVAEIASAIAKRNQGFDDVDRVPAFRRYVQNINRFLDANAGNLRRNGTVVTTPQNARAAIPEVLARVQAARAEIARRASAMRDARSALESLNLSKLVGERVVGRARQKLRDRAAEPASADDGAQLALLRQLGLELLAQRALVRQYASSHKASDYYPAKGNVKAYSDAPHTARAARQQTSRGRTRSWRAQTSSC